MPAPLFNNDGEVQFDVSSGTNGTAVTTAASIIENESGNGLAIMINGSKLYNFDDINDTINKRYEILKYRQEYYEGAVGWYHRPKGASSIFLGYGRGKMENLAYVNDLNLDFLSGNEKYLNNYYHKYFAQFNVGTRHDVVDFIASSRITYFQSYKLESDLGRYDRNINGLFLEPSLTLRLGFRYVKMFMTTGVTIRMPKVEFNSDNLIQSKQNTYPYNYMPMYIGVGLQVNLFNKSFDSPYQSTSKRSNKAAAAAQTNTAWDAPPTNKEIKEEPKNSEKKGKWDQSPIEQKKENQSPTEQKKENQVNFSDVFSEENKQISFDSGNLIYILNQDLESKIHLFPKITDLKSAMIYKTPRDSMFLEIETVPKKLKLNITEANLQKIRDKVDTYIKNK